MAAWADPGIDARAVAAGTLGVGISRFHMTDWPDGVVLGCGAMPLTDVDKAFYLLRSAIEERPV